MAEGRYHSGVRGSASAHHLFSAIWSPVDSYQSHDSRKRATSPVLVLIEELDTEGPDPRFQHEMSHCRICKAALFSPPGLARGQL